MNAIIDFYEDVIARTVNMDKYGRWKSGLYPTEVILRKYCDRGEMQTIEDGDTILAAMAVTDDGDSLGLHVLAVNPDYQGQGLARRLVQNAIDRAHKEGKQYVRLDALSTNIPAHNLYLSLGFVHTHTECLYADNTGWTDFFFFEIAI